MQPPPAFKLYNLICAFKMNWPSRAISPKATFTVLDFYGKTVGRLMR